MPINKNELTKELVEKAVQCKDVNALITLAKAEGIDLTQEEARTVCLVRNWHGYA